MINIQRTIITGEVNPAALMQEFKNRCEMRRLSRAIEEQNRLLKNANSKPAKEKNSTTVYPFPLNDRMKEDLLLLSKTPLVKWNGKSKPDFKNKLLLMVTIEYWRIIHIDIPEILDKKTKWQRINENFLFNGNIPKLGKNFLNSAEYKGGFMEMKNKLVDILKLSKSEISELERNCFFYDKTETFF